MINLLNLELAIINKIKLHSEFGLTFEYPQLNLNSYPDVGWGKVTNLRGPGTPATLGPQGTDEHVGVIQIDVNYPSNQGTATLLNKATEVANAFHAGQSLTEDNISLKLTSVTISPDRIVGGWVRISISVNYFLRVRRNDSA